MVKVVGYVTLKLIGIIHLNPYFENDNEIFQNKYFIWYCLGSKESDSGKKTLFQ